MAKFKYSHTHKYKIVKTTSRQGDIEYDVMRKPIGILYLFKKWKRRDWFRQLNHAVDLINELITIDNDNHLEEIVKCETININD